MQSVGGRLAVPGDGAAGVRAGRRDGPAPGARLPTPLGSVVAVVGAVGGVGASTLAALLAAELARDGDPVGLVDLDPARGGIDVLLGVEARPGARWAELAEVRGTVHPSDLDDVLPTWRGVEVLSAGRGAADLDPDAVAAVVGALTERHEHVVLDLPGRAAADLARLGPDGARRHLVVLTSQDVRGVAGALPIRDRLPGCPAHLVLRPRRDPVVAPSEVAALLGLTLLTTLPRDRGVAGAVDRGLGPAPRRRSPLARAVRRVAQEVIGGDRR